MADPTTSPPEHRLWTVAEADAYLPALDRLLDSLASAMEQRPPGDDGRAASPAVLVEGVFAVLQEDGVIVRDLRRRLVDFRARAGDGSIVLLCRVGDEPTVGWWHGLRDGFVGRRSLAQDPPW